MKHILILSLFMGVALAQTPDTTAPVTTAPAATTPAVDPATIEVARVGDSSITLADFEQSFRWFAAQYINQQGSPYTPQAVASSGLDAYRPKLLQDIVSDRAVQLEAAKQGISLSDEQVNSQITQALSQFTSEEQMNTALNGAGFVDVADYRKALIDRLTYNQLLKAYSNRYNFSKQAIQAYYTAYRESLFKTKPQACAKHILVATPEEAQAVRARLEAGEDFAQVASAVSTDPGSKDQGGELGCFDPGTMVPEFDQAAFETPIGQLTQVTTQFGEHLIIVEKRTEAGYANFKDVAPKIKTSLAMGTAERALSQLYTKYDVQMYPERISAPMPEAEPIEANPQDMDPIEPTALPNN